MPQWQGHLCESPSLNHLTHIDAQSPWCIRDFKLPMNMTEDDLNFDPASIAGFESGALDFNHLMELLSGMGNCGTWDEEELATVFEAAFRLTEAKGQQWLDAVEGRKISDFILMAIDTATIWVRG